MSKCPASNPNSTIHYLTLRNRVNNHACEPFAFEPPDVFLAPSVFHLLQGTFPGLLSLLASRQMQPWGGTVGFFWSSESSEKREHGMFLPFSRLPGESPADPMLYGPTWISRSLNGHP